MAAPPPTALEGAVHVMQVALTPVFLLSGVAALLNVFAARLGRVADQLDALSGEAPGDEQSERAAVEGRVRSLRLRSGLLDWAVVLGALSATATCAAILTLFLASLLSAVAAASVLISLFGLAVLCTGGAVAAFGCEMLIASQSLRLRSHLHVPSLRRRKP